MILEVNPLAQLYVSHKERLEQQAASGQDYSVTMHLVKSNINNESERRDFFRNKYNDTVVRGEIAAVFSTTEDSGPEELNVCIKPRSGELTNLNIRNPLTEPLCYPLMFIYGEAGIL
jgi:hypothetical protein